jgi:hypothetical protein
VRKKLEWARYQARPNFLGGILLRTGDSMKKTNSRRGTKRAKRRASGKKFRQATDLAAIRQQITDLVRNQAVPMVEITISEVDKGHYAAMKYLFEMIGLYPAAAQEESQGEDSLARTLLRRLGLPEEPMLEAEIKKDGQPESAAGKDAVK